jgi:UDP:flavonoid glycosyltransferase YjiC (YdhE family)
MRVLIVGVGSRGDVAPYVGLGQRLQRAGCQVAVATHDTFADMVREIGLEWRRLSGDSRSLIRARMQPGSEADRRRATIDFVSAISDDIVHAADLGTDIILTCLGQTPLSWLVAMGFGVPCMGVYLAPAVPTAEFPMPGSARPDDGDNRAAGQRMLDQARTIYADVLPRLCRRLGLPEDAGEAVWGRWFGTSGLPISLGYSPAIVPRPADWPDSVEVVGYWWPAVPPNWQPSRELTEFLAAGPAPVFVGFGSMGVGVGEQLSPVIMKAVRATGVRAVIQAGWAELSVAGDDVFQVGDVPHEWLFPRMAAAVHHAGAGTTAAGLRAGLPTVAVPVMADQPFWADRVHQLGTGPAPVPFADLTPERLAAAIRAALDEPRYRHRATELAGLINGEDGAGAVLTRIERLTS